MATRLQAEATAARRYGRLSGKYRAELRRLLGNPPDAANVPASFWARVEKETNDELALFLLLLFVMSATHHGATKRSAAGPAAAFAGARASEAARGFTQTSKSLAANASSASDAAAKVFGGERIERMMMHEASTAVSAGAEVGVEASVEKERETGASVVVKRYWAHSSKRPPRHSRAAVEPCPICSPIEGKELSKLPFRFQGGPPAHPNCDCWKRVVIFVDGKKSREYKEL